MATKRKPKYDDRHLGRRIDFYIPETEFDAMVAGMSVAHESNKSLFIRSAIKSYCDYLKLKKENAK